MQASLAIIGGAVWAPGERQASAVAVAEGRIAAIGSDQEIRSLLAPGARVVEARGATIMPAFNDAHVHFLMASRSLEELDLYGALTQADVERRVREHASRHRGTWVVGRGWFYSAFVGGMPTAEQLDRLVPDRPAYLESFDAHTAWVNTRALEVAGISSTGALKEAAMLEVSRHIPARTTAQDLDSLRAGMRVAASRGVASVQEAGDGLDQRGLWRTLDELGELTVRVRLAFDMAPGIAGSEWHRRLEVYEQARSDAHPWVSTGILKAFADGVVESQTAALLEPYADSSELGALLWERDELREAVHAADARGWQVQVHAIGDAAIRLVLDAFEGTTPGRRHRVEHIESPAASDLARFARLGVIASMQPKHADPALAEVWRRNLGPERAGHGWPWRALWASGARLAFGTDWPVVPLDPFAGLRVATKDHAAQRIGLDEALAAWTSGSAYAEHREEHKGALRAGMLADIAVLDRNLSAAPPADIERTKVEATVVGGRLVYES